MLVGSNALAQGGRHVLLVLRPPSDQLLLGIKDDLIRRLHDATITLYADEATDRVPDSKHAEAELSKGREAYEFLRFDESIRHINKAISELKGTAISDDAIDMLKEAYLYLAMNYLALDREQAAKGVIDDYRCISGESRPDPLQYPPSLIALIDAHRVQGADGLLTITITTSPQGAGVFLDGKKAGDSPAVIRAYPCYHFLRLAKHAYITQRAMLVVNSKKTAFNFDMEPDPSAIEVPALDKERTLGMLKAYKADEIVVLSINKDRISISAVKAHPFTASASTLIYEDRKQALAGIAEFILPEKGRTAPDTILSVPTVTRVERPLGTGGEWYENKWLWAAGAAVIAGGLILGLSGGDRKSSPNTGSVSIKW